MMANIARRPGCRARSRGDDHCHAQTGPHHWEGCAEAQNTACRVVEISTLMPTSRTTAAMAWDDGLRRRGDHDVRVGWPRVCLPRSVMTCRSFAVRWRRAADLASSALHGRHHWDALAHLAEIWLPCGPSGFMKSRPAPKRQSRCRFAEQRDCRQSVGWMMMEPAARSQAAVALPRMRHMSRTQRGGPPDRHRNLGRE